MPRSLSDDIKTKTYVIEGEKGNLGYLEGMEAATKNSSLTFVKIPGANHFEVLAPINQAFARWVAKSRVGISPTFQASDIRAIYKDYGSAQREAQDLRDLAAARSSGVAIDKNQELQFYLFAWEKSVLAAAKEKAKKLGFEGRVISSRKTRSGRKYFSLVVTKTLLPSNLTGVFRASRQLSTLGVGDYDYSGWSIR